MQKTKIKLTLPLVITLLCVLITLGAWYSSKQSLNKTTQLRFDTQAQDIFNLIQTKINRDIYLLYNISGFFAASDQVDRDEFYTYINALQLEKDYPGIFSINFVQYIKTENKTAFEESVRLDTSYNPAGYPDFAIYPDEVRPDYNVITFSYPEETTIKGLGFDINSEPTRTATINKALTTNQVAISEKLFLITDNSPAFALYLPVYKNGSDVSTVQNRQENLLGFIATTLKVDQFFSSALKEKNINWDKFDLHIYDDLISPTTSLGELIYDYQTNNNYNTQASAISTQSVLTAAGDQWIIKMWGDRNLNLNSVENYTPWIILIGGLIITAAILFILLFLLTARNRAIGLAEGMTRDIRETEERFRAITEAAKDAIVMMDEQAKVVLWNPAAAEMFGFTESEIMGKELHKMITASAEHQKTERLEIFSQTGKSDVIGKSMELPVKHKDGTTFIVELTIAKTKFKGQWHAIGIMRNITERKKAEKELKVHTDEVEHVNKLMIGRELQMKNLKKEIMELKNKLANQNTGQT